MVHKKIGLYFSSLVLMTFISFIVNSCNSDEYYLMGDTFDMNMRNINSAQESLERVCRDELIDSVAESDVFLDFMIGTKVVMNKY